MPKISVCIIVLHFVIVGRDYRHRRNAKQLGNECFDFGGDAIGNQSLTDAFARTMEFLAFFQDDEGRLGLR
jgi:hypothetical protein